MTCKTQYNRKTLLGTKQLSRHPDAAIPLRSARDRVARRNRIARHCCRTHHCDAPVPMHKVSQHMRNTISQQQQRREKVTRNPQFHCARISSKIPRQSDDAWDRRAREPTFLRNGTQENTMFRKTLLETKYISGLVRMRLHDLLRHMPTGHNDLWVLRMWLHGLLRHMPTGHNDLWVLRKWLHDLLRHMPTGHNDLGASEKVTQWSPKAHANWTQWSLG